jgi:hypothetical protein
VVLRNSFKTASFASAEALFVFFAASGCCAFAAVVVLVEPSGQVREVRLIAVVTAAVLR